MPRLVTCAALAALLLASCARPPVSDEVTIEPSDDTMVVTVSTSFLLNAPNERARARVEAARAAALASTDPWSVRFARLAAPEEERLTYQKQRGTLERVTRSVRIAPDDLQQIFSDTNITVDVLRGDGWRELAFYPGTSGRASREQQAQFESELAAWSDAVARYFTAVHHLYAYLREQPHRDRYLFAALLGEPQAVVLEEEQPLVDAVTRAMEEIADRMDHSESQAATLAEQADLIFNPFPARIRVRPPADVLAQQGFAQKENELVIEPVDLFAAIAALEGKWITPDPLAALLRDEQPAAEEMAARTRESRAVVASSEIARAVREQLARPRTYSVRWRE